jgi:hypothetical protein
MSGKVGNNPYRASGVVADAAAAFDDDQIQSNIAMLGFKVATNGSLVKYNLVDQVIDIFNDTAGVDAPASSNEYRSASGPYYYWGVVDDTAPSGADSTDTSITGYTTLVCSSATGSIVVSGSINVDILVVAGGGAGGDTHGGGGGAGGLIYKSGHALTAQTYAWVRGAGGAQKSSTTKGNPGADSTWTDAGATVEFTAKGGGGGASNYDAVAMDGGSAGGNSYCKLTPVAQETQTSQPDDSGTYGFGGDGGGGLCASSYNVGGGGGAGGAGQTGQTAHSGDGGLGKDYSAIFGTAVGDSGWFASGGGGGQIYNPPAVAGGSNAGGGTDGGTTPTRSASAQALTGGASGGAAAPPGAYAGAGGSGLILVRYDPDDLQSISDMTLQSTDGTALTDPTYGEFVTLIENQTGTVTLNTDIKAYISRDSGTTFTQGTLVDEGTWGTDKKILGFHDLDISGQPSGVAMCYKVTTHNQSDSLKTRVYATSIGWR